MARSHSTPLNEIRFQNAASSPLGRITIAGFGVRQSSALAHPRVLGQYALVYLVNGRGRFADDAGHRRNVEAGDFMLLFPDVAHFYNPLPGTQWVTSYLCFSGPIFDLWRAQGVIQSRKPVHHAKPIDFWSHRLEAVIDASRQAAPALADICRLQHLLAEVVTGAGRPGVYHDDLHWLDRASALIEANLTDTVDWEEVAGQMGLSAESFRKRFTKLSGQPPARYRMGRLVDRACSLMQDRSIKDREIAHLLGFCDEFYFSRRFKAVTGQSPRQFRLNALWK